MPDQSTAVKRCPYCAEDIWVAATTCTYCGMQVASEAPTPHVAPPPPPSYVAAPVTRQTVRRRTAWFIAVAAAVGLVALVVVPNMQLRSAMSAVLDREQNAGVDVSVRYQNYIDRSTLVYDLQSVIGAAPIDVFRVLLQFADEVSDKSFDEVLLAYRGETKFKLEGDYFGELGDEYGIENPVYTARTFPENVLTPSGTRAFGTWTGGIFGVLAEQLEDFNEFHDQWYRDEL